MLNPFSDSKCLFLGDSGDAGASWFLADSGDSRSLGDSGDSADSELFG